MVSVKVMSDDDGSGLGDEEMNQLQLMAEEVRVRRVSSDVADEDIGTEELIGDEGDSGASDVDMVTGAVESRKGGCGEGTTIHECGDLAAVEVRGEDGGRCETDEDVVTEKVSGATGGNLKTTKR